MNRTEILKKANECVTGSRQQDYGEVEDNFTNIARLWAAYLDTGISAEDVAMMMAMVKIARIKSGRYHEDNFIDLAGYAACAGEIAGKVAHNPIDMLKPNCSGTIKKASETNPCLDEIPEWLKIELSKAF